MTWQNSVIKIHRIMVLKVLAIYFCLIQEHFTRLVKPVEALSFQSAVNYFNCNK